MEDKTGRREGLYLVAGFFLGAFISIMFFYGLILGLPSDFDSDTAEIVFVGSRTMITADNTQQFCFVSKQRNGEEIDKLYCVNEESIFNLERSALGEEAINTPPKPGDEFIVSSVSHEDKEGYLLTSSS